MVTVMLTLRLQLPSVGSLKEKRRILKSMFAKLKNKFNISIAEVDHNDVLRTATVGAAVVSNDGAFGDKVIAKVIDWIESNPELIVTDIHTERY